MSRTKGDTLHAARLLQGKLVRLVQRRQRALDHAQSDYRLALVMLVAEANTAAVEIVQQALENDRTAPELAADLRHARTRQHGVLDCEFPEVAPESDDLPPPLPARMIVAGVDMGSAEPGVATLVTHARGADGNEAWGLAELPIEPFADTERGYRYPEPGEPARQLADGRIVADTFADEAPAET